MNRKKCDTCTNREACNYEEPCMSCRDYSNYEPAFISTDDRDATIKKHGEDINDLAARVVKLSEQVRDEYKSIVGETEERVVRLLSGSMSCEACPCRKICTTSDECMENLLKYVRGKR